MTNLDPKLPDPGLGRNPPRYHDDNIGIDTIFFVVSAAIVAVGIIFFALNGASTNTASNPPPTTTGQGGAPVSPTTAPNMAPTPAVPYTTLPTIDQNVPAEKIAPPIPAEPRTNN